MSDIPSFPYAELWHGAQYLFGREFRRHDGHEFLELAAKIPIRTTTQIFALSEANLALKALREGNLTGAAVLVPDSLN